MDKGSHPRFFDWAVAWRAMPGEGVCGDRHVVAPFEGGILLGVMDGLGHGQEAARAASQAAAFLENHAAMPVDEMIRACHHALSKTRGTVMTLVSYNAGGNNLSCTGVGNVEGVILTPGLGRTQSITTRGGVVGSSLPPLRLHHLPVSPGDLLVLVTDGVNSGFSHDVLYSQTPRYIADKILTGHAKDTDDALVLVARYVGDSVCESPAG